MIHNKLLYMGFVAALGISGCGGGSDIVKTDAAASGMGTQAAGTESSTSVQGIGSSALATGMKTINSAPSGSRVCFYEHINYGGASVCVQSDNALVSQDWNDKISSVKLETGYQVELFKDMDFSSNSLKLTGDTPNLVPLNFNDLASSFWISKILPPPPDTWQEHWFEHNQNLQRVFFNDEVAVYFDSAVPRSSTWMNDYLTQAWRYTKKVYGNFGDDRMFAVFHTGKFSGGHPATRFDASHDNRNMIDVGPGNWSDPKDLGLLTHEMAHIVELGSKGTSGSPAFGLWGDSKWAEIYIYDVYRGLGLNDQATNAYTEFNGKVDGFPRANTHWFRDWFYPIYNGHGGAKTLDKYFSLVSQCFPKNGNSYSRGMNWGEFVHFWSGAAGVNLRAQAETAFGWSTQWDNEFAQAQRDFGCAQYPH